ncbi:MAG: lysylphosphatidylglycerol synthase transmembrane domain-containing protein [Chloroflexota bacterium]
MSRKQRDLLFNLARIVISAGLLFWVIRSAGLDQIVGVARNAQPGWIVAAFALSAIGIIVRAYRWQILLNAVSARPPFGRLVYLYFVGQFFSSFLPTGFAGDAVRVIEAGEDVERAKAAGTVIVDRLSGFIGLFALALVALPFAGDQIPAALAWGVGAASIGVVAGAVLLFEGRLLRFVTRPLPRALSLDSDGFVGRTYKAITDCGGRAVIGALIVSTVFNLIQLAANYFMALALGLDVTIGELVLYIPIATVALLIPISVSGLGVREQIYVLLFNRLTAAQATALSFSAYSLDLFNGLIGGVLYLARGLLGLRK